MFKNKFLFFIPLVLVLILAAACGSEDSTSTPQPTLVPQATDTPVSTAMAEPTDTGMMEETPVPTAMAEPMMMIAPPDKIGGVLTMQHYATPGHWSGYEGTFGHQVVNEPMYNNLIEYNPETDDPVDLRGDLADSWELSDDSLSYVFTQQERHVA
jgi:ABC-type transport system substrate-binding protein